MPVEIERKFLVASEAWRGVAHASQPIRQGYLSRDPKATVRVRRVGGQAYLTIKGEGGIARPEYEYEIPLEHADEMLNALCQPPLIEKTRYAITHARTLWTVDEFHGVHAGLVLAEVELRSIDQALELPAWTGREVTHDPRYRNANLVTGEQVPSR